MSSLIATVIVITINLIFKISFLNKSIPLWILIIVLAFLSGFIATTISNIKSRPKLVFYISSQFPDNQFHASLIQNIIHQFEYENIHLIVMLPSKNLDAFSQQRWFSRILKHKKSFLGGLVVPTYLENHKGDLKNFINSFKKPILFIDAPPPFREEEFPENCAFIGYDNCEGGKLAAKAMYHEFKKLESPNFKILIIASKVVSERQEGFRDHLNEIMRERINVIECIDKGHFRREDGFQIYKTVLNNNNSGYLKYQGIFCTNDEMAMGVLRLINETEKIPKENKEKIVIIGYDSITEVVELIESKVSPLKNSVKQDPVQLADRSVNKFLKMFNGERVIKLENIKPELYKKIPL